MIISSPSITCARQALTPVADASVWIANGFEKSGPCNTGAEDYKTLIFFQICEGGNYYLK